MDEIEKRAGCNVLLDEQETTITFSRINNDCIVWTSDSTIITKLDKLCDSAPETYKVNAVGFYKGKIVSKEYLISDKSFITFRAKKKILSEEQKQELAKRFTKS